MCEKYSFSLARGNCSINTFTSLHSTTFIYMVNPYIIYMCILSLSHFEEGCYTLFKYLKSNKQKGNIVNFSWVIVRFLVLIVYHILSFLSYWLKAFIVIFMWSILIIIFTHTSISFYRRGLTHSKDKHKWNVYYY